MIVIGNSPAGSGLFEQYPMRSIEREILDILQQSAQTYRFSSEERLRFELALRREIVTAARELNKSGLRFATFRESKANPDYWERTSNGGFSLRNGVSAAEAIRDIYAHGSRYATECATAMQIVYYKALTELYPDELFNRLFPNLYLMNWSGIAPPLREIGMLRQVSDPLPGDRRYFRNPDVDPSTPEWQGENAVDLGGGLYYGHGIGIHRPEGIIRVLNQQRIRNADDSAYLMDSAGRPDFDRLFGYAQQYTTAARTA